MFLVAGYSNLPCFMSFFCLSHGLVCIFVCCTHVTAWTQAGTWIYLVSRDVAWPGRDMEVWYVKIIYFNFWYASEKSSYCL